MHACIHDIETCLSAMPVISAPKYKIPEWALQCVCKGVQACSEGIQYLGNINAILNAICLRITFLVKNSIESNTQTTICSNAEEMVKNYWSYYVALFDNYRSLSWWNDVDKNEFNFSLLILWGCMHFKDQMAASYVLKKYNRKSTPWCIVGLCQLSVGACVLCFQYCDYQ